MWWSMTARVDAAWSIQAQVDAASSNCACATEQQPRSAASRRATGRILAGGFWGAMGQTARERRAHFRPAGAPFLPEELVVWEILIRLPAKTLLRCGAVCRSWRRLTAAADFLLAHHRRQRSLPLVSFYSSRQDFVAVDAVDLWGASATAERRPVLHFNHYGHGLNFTGCASCDGLLVVNLYGDHFICNPATRQWTALPKLIGFKAAALYYHSSSGEYRILYWKGSLSEVDYYVLTVGSSLEPRFIRRYVASHDPPVLLHNCLHWAFDLGRKKGLFVFDTIRESFKCMRPPTRDNWCHAKVLVMDDMLAISCMRQDCTAVDIWVLQDDKLVVWSLKYQIELPVAELRSIGKSDRFIALVVSENRDVLVVVDGDDDLFYCDSKGKLMQKFHWDRVWARPTDLWFKESLVRHEFFQRQDCVHVEQPRFFPGL